MDLLTEARKLTSKKTANDYKSWCEERIKVLSKRIKRHAQQGNCSIDIKDSKHTAEEVYRHFRKEGFTIFETGREKKGDWYYLCWNKWNGRKPLESKRIKISWEKT